MLGEAIAAVAQRLGGDRDGVLARLGGTLGRDARAAAATLARLEVGAQKVRRASWLAASRLVWPAGFRSIHPTWIEAALAELPARARAAVANGGGGPVDVWLARRALAGFVAMPAVTGAPLAIEDAREPAALPALAPEVLRAWLERAGEDQVARALELGGAAAVAQLRHPAAVARLATRSLGADRAVLRRCLRLADDELRLARAGARAVAPHLTPLIRRQLVQRLPRALGLALRGELAAFAGDPAPTSWAALA